MNIVPVTVEHLQSVGLHPIPATMEGLAVVDGERVMGVAGIYLQEGCLILAARFAAEGRAYLDRGHHAKTLLKAAHRIMGIAKARKLPVYAIAEPTIPGSVNLLRHLGFEHYKKDTYKWPIL